MLQNAFFKRLASLFLIWTMLNCIVYVSYSISENKIVIVEEENKEELAKDETCIDHTLTTTYCHSLGINDEILSIGQKLHENESEYLGRLHNQIPYSPPDFI